MRTLGRGPRNLLLAFHILFAATWLGGVAALILVSVLHPRPSSSEALVVVRTTMQWIDWTLIIPSCLGSLLTGFLSSQLTPWGYFKHHWVVVKWVLTVGMVLFGALALGPWVDATATHASERGIAALDEPAYAGLAGRVVAFAIVQLVLLLVMLGLSAFKPSRILGGAAPRSPRPERDRPG